MMKAIGNNIISLSEVDSTNNYANSLKDDKGAHGTVILADTQIEGRGQRGNSWESEAGKNLTFSVILRHSELPVQNHFMLNIFISLSICHAIKECTGKECKIKWPNDIYISNNKICGILTENTINGSYISKSIIGIGLNVNQACFSEGIPNPTSIYLETGCVVSIENIFKQLVESMNIFYDMLASKKYEYLNDAYLSNLYRIGEVHSFFDRVVGHCSFEGKIVGISEIGQLQILDSCGKLREFNFKELEFVI